MFAAISISTIKVGNGMTIRKIMDINSMATAKSARNVRNRKYFDILHLYSGLLFNGQIRLLLYVSLHQGPVLPRNLHQMSVAVYFLHVGISCELLIDCLFQSESRLPNSHTWCDRDLCVFFFLLI